MDIRGAPSNHHSNSLPQGFSVYQPTLGAQLQFFPAMGSKELDEMLHTYLPGPAPIVDKRAAVSVDFLEHLHMSGQTFKFYPVEAAISAPSVSASSSPVTRSGGSSLSGLPDTPTWDFNNINNISFTPSSNSSQISTSALKSRKTARAAFVSRHQTTDFSHLPGMKIMTKDGVDVTNAASRGSKTKEQRDHAHLMRIIKACDVCRAKKVRCDPSHKRRASSTISSAVATPASPTPSNARQKKQSPVSKSPQTALPQPRAPSIPLCVPSQEFSWDDFDASMATAGMDSFESFDDFIKVQDPWSEFIHFPEDAAGVDDYVTLFDSEGNVSPSSSFTSTTTSSGSSTKPPSPSSACPRDEMELKRSASQVDDNHDTWSHELGLASIGTTHLCTQLIPHTMNAENGTLHVSISDGSGIPGDHGIDATLLSTAETVLSRHCLEDPGTFANSASLPELPDISISPFSPATSPHVDGDPAWNSREATGLQPPSPSPSSAIVPGVCKGVTIHASARTLVRPSPDGVAMAMAPITEQEKAQGEFILAGIGSHGGIPGLLPMSGPIAPGLVQVKLGGTDATSTAPSSKSQAELLMAVALMGTSFIASVGRMLARSGQDQIAASEQQCRLLRKASAASGNGLVPQAYPRLFGSLPLVARVC